MIISPIDQFVLRTVTQFGGCCQQLKICNTYALCSRSRFLLYSPGASPYSLEPSVPFTKPWRIQQIGKSIKVISIRIFQPVIPRSWYRLTFMATCGHQDIKNITIAIKTTASKKPGITGSSDNNPTISKSKKELRMIIKQLMALATQKAFRFIRPLSENRRYVRVGDVTIIPLFCTTYWHGTHRTVIQF